MKRPRQPQSRRDSPYPGPRPFRRAESDRFFGRGKEIADLRDLALSYRLTVFYAQSGAGKTSLVNAGLWPELEKEGTRVLVSRVGGTVTPRAAASGNVFVAAALAALRAGEDGSETMPAPDAAAAQSLTSGLVAALTGMGAVETGTVARSRRAGPDTTVNLTSTVVLIVDQFEELFTTHQAHWKQRRGFFDQLGAALRAIPDLNVVFSIREDYIAELDPYGADLPQAMRIRYRLERLHKQEAIEAIVRPLAARGITLRTRIAERAVEDLLTAKVIVPGDDKADATAVEGEHVEPVHLQIVCENLWRALSQASPQPGAMPADDDASAIWFEREGRIFRADGSAVRDIDESLIAIYERAMARARTEAGVPERRLRALVGNQLVTSGGTRGFVDRGRFVQEGIEDRAVDAVIAVWEDERLIRREPRAGAPWFELTHDRFIEPIRRANARWEQGRRQRWVMSVRAIAAGTIVLAWGSAHLYANHVDKQKLAAEAELKQVSTGLEKLALANSSFKLVSDGAAPDAGAPGSTANLFQQVEDETRLLKEQIALLRRQNQEYADRLRALQKVATTAPRPPAAKPVLTPPERLFPMSALVKPRASSKPVRDAWYKAFDFSVWVDVPAERKSEIRRVVYTFDHPTFKNKTQTSKDASTGFRVGYRGWGCLTRMVITLEMANGEKTPLDFDMCSALRESEPAE